MFKKPLSHQSNATPIRSSTRRALVADIVSSYPTLATSRSRDNATIDEVNERDKSERELGRLIMPDGIRACSFETSGGIEGVSCSPLVNDLNKVAVQLILRRICIFHLVMVIPFGHPLVVIPSNSYQLVSCPASSDFSGDQSLHLGVYSLSLPTPKPILPILKLHHPLPPPLLAGAPLFIGAVRDLPRPHLLPDIPEGGLVAFVIAPQGDESNQVQYAGVGKLVSPGGMKGAWERRGRAKVGDEEGVFCEILCIIGDQ